MNKQIKKAEKERKIETPVADADDFYQVESEIGSNSKNSAVVKTPKSNQDKQVPSKPTEVHYNTQPAYKTPVACTVPNMNFTENPIRSEDLMMNDTLKACIDKITSIELKRLTIIEKEMDKIIQGNTDLTLFNSVSNMNLGESLNMMKHLNSLGLIGTSNKM